MELTREEIEGQANGSLSLDYKSNKIMAQMLLAEMDKPGVWDNAPEWATKAVVNWSAKTHYSGIYHEYTRELPKSPVREIAEKWANTPTPQPTRKYLADTIEAAINEYKELSK